MKTSTIRSMSIARVLLPLSLSILASCTMPPRQAWNMIQHEGLFNYWAYSSGQQPLYRAPMASPPLQRSSLVYRPPYARYGDNFASSYRTSSLPSRAPSVSTYRAPSPSAPSMSQNRYLSPPSTPRVVYEMPESKPKSKSSSSSSSSSRRTTKPKVAARPKTQERTHDEPLPPRTKSATPSIASKKETTPDKKPTAGSPKAKELPFGTSVAGRPNMVNSPYAGKNQLVDVGGLGTGQTVKCPYSGKLFKVPPSQQAANKVESQLDAPKLSSPSKDSDKPAPKSEEKPKSEEPKP